MSPNKRRLRDGWIGVDHALLEELSRESDRAAAVLAGSYLDALLEELLRSVLVDGGARKGGRALLSGALYAFTNRIDAAYALGLISAEEAAELWTINEIRNVFAHQLVGITFKSPDVEASCDKLTVIGGAAGKVDARMLFLFAAALMSLQLVKRTSEASTLQAATNTKWPLASTTSRKK